MPIESNDNTSSRLDLVIPTLLAVVIILFCIVAPNLNVPASLLGSILTAVVACFAIWSASTFSERADERARRASSFEIARRWDQEPYLRSRETIREINKSDLVDKIDDRDIKIALIHFANYYWELAVAIDKGWADSSYVRERFRATLVGLYPAFNKMLAETDDPSAPEALETIGRLHLKWGKAKETRSKEAVQERLRILAAQIADLKDQ